MENTWNDQLEIEGDARANFDSEEALARNPFWYCEACNAQNSRLDGECQFCEPEELLADAPEGERGFPEHHEEPCEKCQAKEHTAAECPYD